MKGFIYCIITNVTTKGAPGCPNTNEVINKLDQCHNQNCFQI